MLKVGDQIQVKILKLDKDAHKIGLGLKQLQSNPWASIEQRYPVGNTVSGRVTRTTDFGAFVELEQGVEGLIHISELEHRRVGRVTEIVNEGDQVDAKVLAVEPSRKRISLSLKALKNKPEAAPPPPVEQYERKNKGPLRGGRESDSGKRSSGLFGNPDDFKR
jgi:small subunit ribosomal protein S1